MRKLRRIGFLAILLLITGLISNVGNFPKVLSGEKKEINFLSGLPGKNQKLLAVKLDDTKQAHPQIGIQAADLVFVEQVESGLTRLLALYSSVYPPSIGPIRSARISDIDLLAQFGKVAFAYSGSQTKMRPVLASANLNNLSAEKNPPSIFSRAADRIAPVDMILDPEKLLAHAIDRWKMSLISLTAPVFEFGEVNANSISIVDATVKWPNAKYLISWDKSRNAWNLMQNDFAEVDANTGSIYVDNAIIQIVEISPSIYGDKFGGITPISKTVGNGDAYLLRDGKYLPIKWQRADAQNITTWVDLNDDPVNLKAGKTWIFLTGSTPTFGYQP